MDVNRLEKANEMVELGRDYFTSGKMHEARDCFFHAIEMDPANSPALNGYATVLCELNGGEWNDAAVKYVVQALQADSRNVKAWNNLGDYHYRRGEFDQAIEYFERAVVLDPSYSVAFINLGLSYRNTNRSDDALQALKKGLSMDPYSGWARYQLALTYLHRGIRFNDLTDVEKARQVLISIEEKNLPNENMPVDRMIRTISTYLTMHQNTDKLKNYLADNTQYYGDKHDEETYACLLN